MNANGPTTESKSAPRELPRPEPAARMPLRAWLATAIVSAMFTLAVAAAMLLNHERSVAEDPLNGHLIQLMREQWHKQPGNEALKGQIRALDLAERQHYFKHVRRQQTGAALLLAGGIVSLVSFTRYKRLRRAPPVPRALAPWKQLERENRQALQAVAAVAAVMFAALLVLSARPRVAGTNEQGQSATTGQTPSHPDLLRAAWPRFRGPDGSGVSTFTNIPATWNIARGENIAWMTRVPLGGNSSPVLAGHRLFLTGAEKNRRELYCFDTASGALLWRRDPALVTEAAVEKMELPTHAGGAASTVAADDRNVYALFATGELIAVDHAGRPVWSKNFGKPENAYGHATSLLVWRNLVLVQLDQGRAEAGKSRLYALDGATGRLVWEQRRATPSTWATPLVVPAAGADQLVTMGDPWLISYNLADGREQWRFGGFGGDLSPSPVLAGSLILAINPGRRLVAIRADGAGDVTGTHLVWAVEVNVPDITSPVNNGELVFMLESYGILTCLEAASGKKLWEHAYAGEFHASPAIAGDRLLVISIEGQALVSQVGREFRPLWEGSFGEPVEASPAFGDGTLFVRGATNLFCIAAAQTIGGAP